MATLRLLMIGMAISFIACQPEVPLTYLSLDGQAQGTTYHITYADPQERNFQSSLDSIFDRVNASLSTYHQHSLISQFNRTDSLPTEDPLFMEMIRQSRQYYEDTEGVFDPTVMPLVRAWGFGPEKEPTLNTNNLDSLKGIVGFEQLMVREGEIRKGIPGMQLDFNAIAQGYTVDLIGEFLAGKGIVNYLVELGGEVLVKGKNAEGENWTLGIEQPLEIPGIQSLAAKVALKNQALSTSGSYKKFYLKDGVKYSHTIDPFTARPVTHSLLSVTIIADDCAKADAFATACMVWGAEKSMEMLSSHPDWGMNAYFISASKGEGWEIAMTEGMKALIVEE